MPLALDDNLPNVEFTDSSGSITNLYAYTGNKWLMIFTHKKFLHPSFATVRRFFRFVERDISNYVTKIRKYMNSRGCTKILRNVTYVS